MLSIVSTMGMITGTWSGARLELFLASLKNCTSIEAILSGRIGRFLDPVARLRMRNTLDMIKLVFMRQYNTIRLLSDLRIE